MGRNTSDWDTGCIGDFFEAGRAYTTQTGYLAPELEWNFACAKVARTPDGELIAFGFLQDGRPKWTATGLGRRDFLDHAWNPASPPEWLVDGAPAQVPSSPLAQAEDAKRARDLVGEVGILMAAGADLESAPWHPVRAGDLVHVHYEAGGLSEPFGETYLIAAGKHGFLSMQLLAHTLPESEDAAGLVGCFAVEDDPDPLMELWFEAGPHRLTIVRDGRPVHIGGAR